MKKWTKQTIFNHVSKHLIDQNSKAYSYTKKICLGFDPKTNKRCAAGCLIPISEWKKIPASNHVSGSEYVCDKLQITEYRSFVSFLQNIHDNKKPSRWKQSLRQLAKINNLKIPDCIKE